MTKMVVTIRQRTSWEGPPFSELLFVADDKHYLTRVPYAVSNTAEQREYELQEFKRRQARR